MWVDTNLKLSAVPVVMVFTKLDELQRKTRESVHRQHPGAAPDYKDFLVNKEIERVLHSNYLEPICQFTGKENFPHVKVSGKNSPKAQHLMLSPDL